MFTEICLLYIQINTIFLYLYVRLYDYYTYIILLYRLYTYDLTTIIIYFTPILYT